MKKGLIALIIGLVVIVGGYFMLKVNVQNNIIDKEEGVSNQWSKVESAYQRRADLIPNLVSTVKSAADYEKETLTQVIEARSKATSVQLNVEDLNEQSLQKFQEAQDGLSSALSRLMVSVERYPELKANRNFIALQSQLEGTENRIKVERDRFGDQVKSYNGYIRKFPGSLFADGLGAEPKPYFKSVQGSETAPSVDELMNK